MRKSIIVLFLVMLFFGALIVFIPNATACHSKSVSCEPSTEQDIIDHNTYMIKYELDVSLNPGCGNRFWVGFTLATSPPNGWAIKLYEKDDSTKTSILGSGTPPDANHANWAHWIPNDNNGLGPGSTHYYATLEVKVIDTINVDNGDSATVSIDCWSCDSVPNDLDQKTVITTTTLNIPHGIRLEHKLGYMIMQKVNPGQTAIFNIKLKDLGNASGLVDLDKGQMSSDCFNGGAWVYELPTQVTLPENDTTDFTLKVTPPLNAELNDYGIFIIEAKSQANPVKYFHTVSAKTIIKVPLPDLVVKSNEMKCLEDGQETNDISDGEIIDVSIDVHNLGDDGMDVSNFEAKFWLNDPGNEKNIDTITVTDTIACGQKTTVICPWKAIEGDHSIMVTIDEKDLVDEKDEITGEENNEAGIVVNVGPAIPKSIIITNSLDPSSVMPETQFTVSGTANYNPEYDSLPVTDANVEIKIVETGIIYNTKTDSEGKYTKQCTAPAEEGTYTVQVNIKKDSITATVTDYLSVSAFQINLLVKPRTVITGEDVVISGRVTDGGFSVVAADVTIYILDEDGNEAITPITTKTDTQGSYTTTTKAPSVTEYTEYDVKVTATKDDISGVQMTKLWVDIDTDGDGKCNSEDTDDDDDEYPDNVEAPDFDPLDPNDKPSPMADAGDDKTVNEAVEVSFDGEGSYSPVGINLKYSWDFDGDFIEDSNEKSPKHTFDKPGSYEVILTVDDDYEIDTDTITVTVEDLIPTVIIEGPISGTTDKDLSYEAKVTPVTDDAIVKYEWDMDGDDDVDKTGSKISHKWLEGDDYTITLRVTDDDGSVGTTTLDVKIIGGKDDSDSDTADKGSEAADYTVMYIAIIVVIIIIVLLALFFIMRKKKPAATSPDQRVAGTNLSAQDSRRPTTQFAEADIKPAMGAAPVQRPAMPGTVPPQGPAVAPTQRSALPPPTPTTPGQKPSQEQRDWSWNFDE